MIDLLAKKKIFSTKEASQLLSTKPSIVKVILSRLEKKGWIERIEPGKYMVIPLGSQKGTYTLHEFVLGATLVSPCIISYWTALHHYGLTEQIPNTVFIQTTARKKHQEPIIFGVHYKIIRIKPEKIFGTTTEWIEDTNVIITDKEKTIIDCLDKPQYCGGIIEVAKALNTKTYDIKKLETYANNIDNNAVIRRLGYLCEILNIPIKSPPITSRNYQLLNPARKQKGTTNHSWRLYINETFEGLE